ncbi:hypothetical protein AB0G55_13240 [Streptomyces toyocaensis]|uniref:hypothetical protein n=1 Tax=Streptomyces toyocaensis TaxID=55952 RepID=UPI000AFF0F9C|nr:hypothetical protein [Streptomyces toyocaensis]
MQPARNGMSGSAEAPTAAGRTRWGIVALILGAPALLVCGLLFTLLLWVVAG